jgi:hypothetical protein
LVVRNSHQLRYPIGVTDHLVQQGEKMIITADHNICYAEDPPPPTKVQISNTRRSGNIDTDPH